MSAILEALKKSEQERKLGQSPSLQSIHHGMNLPANSKAPTSLWLVGVLILLSFGVIFYLLWVNLSVPSLADSSYSTERYSADDYLKNAKIAVPPPENLAATKPKNLAITTTNNPSSTKSSTTSSTTETEPKKEKRVAMPLWQLPTSVRSSLPAMTYSFHVYSGASENRTIIINGRRLKEGDAISNELRLDEITSEGVVLEFQQYLVFVPVLDGW
jgi:general secretion pathway protein B